MLFRDRWKTITIALKLVFSLNSIVKVSSRQGKKYFQLEKRSYFTSFISNLRTEFTWHFYLSCFFIFPTKRHPTARYPLYHGETRFLLDKQVLLRRFHCGRARDLKRKSRKLTLSWIIDGLSRVVSICIPRTIRQFLPDKFSNRPRDWSFPNWLGKRRRKHGAKWSLGVQLRRPRHGGGGAIDHPSDGFVACK